MSIRYIKSIASGTLKFLLASGLSAAALIIAIMLHYDVSLHYVLTASDPQIESELSIWLTDIHHIAKETFMNIPSLAELAIFEPFFSLASLADSPFGQAQSSLFQEFFSILVTGCTFGIVLYIFQTAKQLIEKLMGKIWCCYIFNVLCYIQILYITTISSSLIIDYLMEAFYNKHPLLAYVVVILFIFAVAAMKAVWDWINTTDKKQVKFPKLWMEEIGLFLLNMVVVTMMSLLIIGFSISFTPYVSGIKELGVWLIILLYSALLCFCIWLLVRDKIGSQKYNR